MKSLEEEGVRGRGSEMEASYPTVGLCPGPFSVPRGVAFYHQRGTSVGGFQGGGPLFVERARPSRCGSSSEYISHIHILTHLHCTVRRRGVAPLADTSRLLSHTFIEDIHGLSLMRRRTHPCPNMYRGYSKSRTRTAPRKVLGS